MKSYFAIALLATAILAKVRLPSMEENEFLEFAGKFNKHYKDTKTMEERIQCWKDNKERVAKLKANGKSKAKFEVNETADLTDAEYLQMQGVKLPEDVELPDQAE